MALNQERNGRAVFPDYVRVTKLNGSDLLDPRVVNLNPKEQLLFAARVGLNAKRGADGKLKLEPPQLPERYHDQGPDGSPMRVRP